MFRMRWWLPAVLFIAALCCGQESGKFKTVAAEADSPVAIVPRAHRAPSEAAAVLRIDSALVLIPVRVTNPLGVSIDGLRRDSFRLLEDSVEQTITTFVTEDAPVSVGLVFDISGSMRPKVQKSTEAAAAFFRTANREDEFFLVEFNERARLIAPFTADYEEIYRDIVRTRPRGPTALIDAIFMSLAQMKHARRARKALVILSDGGDNWSRHSARALRRVLLESDVQVYAIGIFDQEMRTTEEKNGPRLLDDLTMESGGRLYPVDDLQSLPEISARIGRELRSQYVLGYYSTNPVHDGKYRRVTVKLTVPNIRELHTDYRRGYYAPLD
jgi:Ca-activated chloride channel family protein